MAKWAQEDVETNVNLINNNNQRNIENLSGMTQQSTGIFSFKCRHRFVRLRCFLVPCGPSGKQFRETTIHLLKSDHVATGSLTVSTGYGIWGNVNCSCYIWLRILAVHRYRSAITLKILIYSTSMLSSKFVQNLSVTARTKPFFRIRQYHRSSINRSHFIEPKVSAPFSKVSLKLFQSRTSLKL
jgi:hypothetical protein